MALRGWRLFGVAGTIFAYVAGILLLSIVSLQNTQQRRPRVRSITELDSFRNRESGLGIGKRPPLQWCRELRYLDNGRVPFIETEKVSPKLLQTFPGHYVKKSYYSLRGAHKRDDNKFDDRFNKKSIDNLHNEEIKLQYEPIWPTKMKTSWKSNLQQTIVVDNQHQNDQHQQTSNTNKSSRRILTALASFPGSGNTWLRYLLQQATGILTGSIYKDYGLLKSGFPAEKVYNSSVLIVKTHEWGPNAWSSFGRAILLVRDPDKAILAEFNRQSGGHVGFASPDRYKRTKGRYWQQFVINNLRAWEQMNLAWAKNFTGELKIVFYDDLVNDVETVLRQILKFIEWSIDEDLLSCALLRREGIYKRKRRLMSFDPFSTVMREALSEKRDEVYAALGRVKT